jgi:hypothetical protein
MSIFSPDADASAIFFGSPSDVSGAFVRWDYTGDELRIASAKAGAEVSLKADNSVFNLTLAGAATAETAKFEGGISLSGNTLDDYEEGTWTPAAYDAASGGNAGGSSTADGRYTKIGNLVTVTGRLTAITTVGMTAGNDMFIGGLPFTTSGAPTARGTMTMNNVTYSGYVIAQQPVSGDRISLQETISASGQDSVIVSQFATGSADVFFTLTYEVA